QQVAGTHPEAGSAAGVDLPSIRNRDRAEVLYRCLSTIPRASTDRQLHLVRRFDSLKTALDSDAEAGRVAETVAAEITSDTGLASAKSFGVGVSARHSQVLPNGRQVLLGDSQQINSLAAGDLDHAGAVLLGNICQPPQLAG